MNDYKMYFTNEELKDERVKLVDFLNRFGPMLADEIKNNPQFLSRLKRALNICQSQNDSVNVKISKDGKELILRTDVEKGQTGNPYLQDNISFSQTRFSLDGQSNLLVSESKGTMYNFDDYIKDGNEKMANFTSSQTPTVLSVAHGISGYTPDGIECVSSSFYDSCPLGVPKNSQALIYETLNSHYPSDWKQNVISPGPQTVYGFDPSTYYYSRNIDTLGVASVVNTHGKVGSPDFKISHVFCPVQGEHPEYMEVLTDLPLATIVNGKYELTDWAKQEYPNMTYEQLASEFSKGYSMNFLKKIEDSKIKESSPELYNNLKEKIIKGIGYDNIEEKETQESQGMKM